MEIFDANHFGLSVTVNIKYVKMVGFVSKSYHLGQQFLS